ncbi:NEDD4 family-interacting protein 2 [Microtus ochrogaster]|uniref:NEDD4 family-interacting protein 2 n=1 Tax=Microtus ochrogaster TaxID=79684 RepID=A0A8J6GSH9_MICOH|nr:NEDD4 family-interacting protein 2 [Microtus ochrogaster]
MERRRRSQRACASNPSMLSSSRGSPELLRRPASEAEVSAVAEGATGSEAAPPGDRGGRTRGGGRGSAATTSSTGGEAEGAERRGDTPARKPDPEAGRMDHHQLGTGRYQVVSTRAPGHPEGPRSHPGEHSPGHPAGPRSHLRATPGITGRATLRDHAGTSGEHGLPLNSGGTT